MYIESTRLWADCFCRQSNSILMGGGGGGVSVFLFMNCLVSYICNLNKNRIVLILQKVRDINNSGGRGAVRNQNISFVKLQTKIKFHICTEHCVFYIHYTAGHYWKCINQIVSSFFVKYDILVIIVDFFGEYSRILAYFFASRSGSVRTKRIHTDLDP